MSKKTLEDFLTPVKMLVSKITGVPLANIEDTTQFHMLSGLFYDDPHGFGEFCEEVEQCFGVEVEDSNQFTTPWAVAEFLEQEKAEILDPPTN